MEFFQWKEGFSIGIPEMDAQHQKFLAILNEVHGKVGTVAEADLVADYLSTLKGYINIHFREEETLLEAAGYPGLEKHRQEHAFFQAQIEDFHSGGHAFGRTSLSSLLQFMKDWFMTHITETDRLYTPFARREDGTTVGR